MTTITLKVKSKRDVIKVFDFAKQSNIEMIVEASEHKKSILRKEDRFYIEFSESVKEAKEIANGTKKGQTLKSFLDEL